MKQLHAMVSTRGDLGEGYSCLPWYWRMAPARSEEPSEMVEVPNSDVEWEYQDST